MYQNTANEVHSFNNSKVIAEQKQTETLRPEWKYYLSTHVDGNDAKPNVLQLAVLGYDAIFPVEVLSINQKYENLHA